MTSHGILDEGLVGRNPAPPPKLGGIGQVMGGFAMGLFSWLFGKKPAITATREDEPLPPFRFRTDHQLQSKTPYVFPPAQKTTHWPDMFEYWIDYSTGGDPAKRRRVVFLMTSPGNMVTAVDLDKRRIRTYRLDRIGLITDPRTQIILPARQFFNNDPPIKVQWDFRSDAHETAVIMLQQMLCQISLCVLMANSGNGITPNALEIIMEYIRRDARFAVRSDFVPKGSKTDVWPILRDIVYNLQPRRDHVTIYAETLNDEWENSRRFSALNDVLTVLCHFEGGPTVGQRQIAGEINDALGK